MIKVEIRKKDKICIIDLNGALDLDGAKLLKESIEKARKESGGKILINFTGVRNVQSSVLQSLVTPIKVVASIGGIVGFFGMSPGVHKMMKSAMFYPIITVYETEEEGLAGFGYSADKKDEMKDS